VDLTAPQITQISQLAAKLHVLTNDVQWLVVLFLFNIHASLFSQKFLQHLLLFLLRRILRKDFCSFVMVDQFFNLFDRFENSRLHNRATVSYETLDSLDTVIDFLYQTDMQL
jgi:hypothetical protein